MLHGGGPGASGLSNYHQNLPALSTALRVVLLDQPGFGGSYRPTQDDLDRRSITQISVQALYEALDELGITTFIFWGTVSEVPRPSRWHKRSPSAWTDWS